MLPTLTLSSLCAHQIQVEKLNFTDLKRIQQKKINLPSDPLFSIIIDDFSLEN